MFKGTPQPQIGISGSGMDSASVSAIITRISEAGGAVNLIINHGAHDAEEDFSKCHGWVVMGNNFDIDPEHYIHRYAEGDARRQRHPATRSERECEKATARANYENKIIQLALEHRVPLLCICGGMHRLNVLCGGTLLQHVPDMVGSDKLRQDTLGLTGEVPTIPILIECGTRLSMIAEKIQMGFVKPDEAHALPKVIMENSFRHQSIDMVAEGFRVCAQSDTIRMKDGTSRYLIEAIEPTPGGPYDRQFILGVQWHPEFCASDIGRALFKNFLQAVKIYHIQR